MKNLIIPILVILVIVGAIVIFGSSKNQNSASNNSTSSTSSTSSSTASPSYFDENAKVEYFYSDACHWCQQEKSVLEELAKEGYRVKPMDVGVHQDYWATYGIEGTPTFVAPDGQRMVGYKEKAELKAFLGKYK